MYKVSTTSRFDKELKKLDKYLQLMIVAWIDKNLVNCQNPKANGKELMVNRSGQWRYWIGDYRLICKIEDEKIIILALSIGHRREMWDN